MAAVKQIFEQGALREREQENQSPLATVIGWQGIRCELPPDWNLTSFSTDRDNGYLRVDAPGDSALTVQIRWMNAERPQQGRPSLYTQLAPHVRRLLRRPELQAAKPELKANLERILKETAKQARKANAPFESNLKPERVEGENGERKSINFSWSGAGRGQGKIWHCSVCNRVVVAQVVGIGREQTAMSQVASQLFATLHDHSIDGYDRWALYDLQIDVPDQFRLEEQKLLSGYQQLILSRGSERLVVDRWGLANMTLKKFTLDEWFRNHARVRLKRMKHDEIEGSHEHCIGRYAGHLSLLDRVRGLRPTPAALLRPADRYEGGAWVCAASNRIYSVQLLHNHRAEGLWSDLVSRCRCHGEFE